MLIDHLGSRLFVHYALLRIIGRLAFPIFAFCLAQGCRYTRHKGKHLALIAGVGVVWEAALHVYHGEWKGNILLTFTLSTILIYAMQAVKKQLVIGSRWRQILSVVCMGTLIATVYCLTEHVYIQYRFFGILLAPAVALLDYEEGAAPLWMRKWDALPVKLIMLALFLVLQAWPTIGKTVQLYSLCAVPVLALYNGRAGNRRLKYAFYVFYPLHLIVIEGIKLAILRKSGIM